MQQLCKQLNDGVGSEVGASSAESNNKDEEAGVSLEWGGFGEKGFGQSCHHASSIHTSDPEI